MSISDLNRELISLALEYKIKDSKGKAVVAQMIEDLKTYKNKSFTIDRSIIAGADAKARSRENSDFDCVLFINGFEATRRAAILKELESIFQSESGVRIGKATEFAVKLKIGDVGVDLYPVANCVTEGREKKKNTRKMQKEAVLAYLMDDPSKHYEYDAALAEGQVGFMKKQTPFVHELVMLCQYWNKSAGVHGRICGRSTLIELIAVHAGQEVEQRFSYGNKTKNNMYDGFRKFLSSMTNLSANTICFGPSGKSFQGHLLNLTNSFVLEPANPLNNLIKNVRSFQMDDFRNKAMETRQRLEGAEFVHCSIESIFA